MNITNEIARDHRHFRELIKKIRAERSQFKFKRSAFQKLAALVIQHTKAEEKTVYAFARKKRALKMHALEAWEEHEAAKILLLKLKRTKAQDLWEARAKLFCQILESHMDEEEGRLLPEVEKALNAEKNDALAVRFRTFNPEQITDDERPFGVLIKAPFSRPLPVPMDVLVP